MTEFARAWPHLGDNLVLVVDGANVVGSRPDGWWRDRRGANERLRDGLARLAEKGFSDPDDPARTWYPKVILVVEGKASGVKSVPGVDVVAADTDGDSKIVEVTRDTAGAETEVLVATADRELRGRVTHEGAAIVGPGTLRDFLDAL